MAVAGLSTAAFAQTNVTIYGVVDVSGQGYNQTSVKNGSSGNDGGNVFGMQNNSSLLGFKGAEDLGNGLKAIFQAETKLNITGTNNNTPSGAVAYGTTNSVFSNLRDSFIGLNSKYGTLLGGYVSTPLRSSLTSFDVMPGATGASQIEKQMTAIRMGGAQYQGALRATGIAYQMPTLYGFNASIAYTGSNNNGTTNSTDPSGCANAASACSVVPQSAFGFNLSWTGYGASIIGAFQQNNNQTTPNYTTANVSGSTIGISNQPSSGQYGDYTSYLVGAQYTGVPGLKLSTVFVRNTLGANGALSNPNSAAIDLTSDAEPTVRAGQPITNGAGKLTNNQLWAGASYRMGNWEPRISASWSSDVNGSEYQQLGSRQWTANVGYFMSKRTQVYGLVSNINNSANQNYTFGEQATNLGSSRGSNLFTYGMGMRTSF